MLSIPFLEYGEVTSHMDPTCSEKAHGPDDSVPSPSGPSRVLLYGLGRGGHL